jgi:hypothetical protein
MSAIDCANEWVDEAEDVAAALGEDSTGGEQEAHNNKSLHSAGDLSSRLGTLQRGPQLLNIKSVHLPYHSSYLYSPQGLALLEQTAPCVITPLPIERPAPSACITAKPNEHSYSRTDRCNDVDHPQGTLQMDVTLEEEERRNSGSFRATEGNAVVTCKMNLMQRWVYLNTSGLRLRF